MNRKHNTMEEPMPAEVAETLDVLRSVPAVDEAVWAKNRRAFLAEAHQFSTKAVTPVPVLRRRTWKRFLPINLKGGSMAALVKVLIVAALVFGGAAGTVSASQESLPGTLLYPVKAQVEDWRLDLTQNSESQAELAMEYAQNRIEEVERLVAQDDDVPEDVVGRYQHQVQIALQATEEMTEPLKLRTQASFSGTLQSQVRVMERVMERVNANPNQDHTEPTQARIQEMVQTMLQAQKALGNEGHHGGTAGPGPNPSNNGNGSDGQCMGDCGGSDNDNGNNGQDNDNGQQEPGGGKPDGAGGDKDNGQEGGNPADKGSDSGRQCMGDCGGPNGGNDQDNGNGQDNQGGSGDNGNGDSDNGNGGDGGGNGGGDNGGDGGNSGGNGGGNGGGGGH